MIPSLLLIFLSLFGATAEARIYDLYRADRRFKGAFCTAIGGACAADNDIITAIFENPSALATGVKDWDFDGDYSSKSNLEPGMSDANNSDEATGNIGASYTNGHFGMGVAFSLLDDNVDSNLTLYDDSGLPKTVPVHDRTRSYTARIPLGWQLSPKLSVGTILAGSWQSQQITIAGGSPEDAASGFAFGITLGALYTQSPRLRLGAWFRMPNTLFETLQVTATSLATTINYREDLALHNPWILAFGSQIAIGDADLLYLELDAIGMTSNAYVFSYNSLSAAINDFALTPKGRRVAFEPHAGYRLPLKGKTKLHLGSYFEAPRTQGISGRLHGTTGVSFELFNFIEIIGGIDFASQYQQVIFSFR